MGNLLRYRFGSEFRGIILEIELRRYVTSAATAFELQKQCGRCPALRFELRSLWQRRQKTAKLLRGSGSISGELQRDSAIQLRLVEPRCDAQGTIEIAERDLRPVTLHFHHAKAVERVGVIGRQAKGLFVLSRRVVKSPRRPQNVRNICVGPSVARIDGDRFSELSLRGSEIPLFCECDS
jgi:hypothetical protein